MSVRITRLKELLALATPDPKGTGYPSQAAHEARKREQTEATQKLLLEIPALLVALGEQDKTLTILRNLLADDLERRGFHAQAVETRKNYKP